MDKTKLRIMSKIGLIIVMIGFCMPVACNANGFQIAEFGTNFSSQFGTNSSSGINILSIALYGIFVFSCLGSILLLLLVMKKQFSMGWDWLAVIGVTVSTVFVIYRFSLGDFNLRILQSGTYFILLGLILSLIFLLMASSKKEDGNNTQEVTDV